jgi:hypothetical protein
MRGDQVATTARRRALVLTLVSAFGTVGSLGIWLLFGWFWGLCGLLAVCLTLAFMLFIILLDPRWPPTA